MKSLFALLILVLPFHLGLMDVGHTDPDRSTAEREAKKTQTVSEYIQGHVLKMDTGSWVVKDDTGKEVQLQVTGATQLDPNLKVGDKVRAQTTPEGKVTSIKKASTKQ